jgi:predicted nucleic acid-binding protein
MFTKHVEPTQHIDAITEDSSDNRILECAAVGNSEYLVTGDNHLLKLKQLQRVAHLASALRNNRARCMETVASSESFLA